MSSLERSIAAMRGRYYDALKAHDPELYRRTIEAAQCVILNHDLGMRAGVDCEAMAVLAVCRALNLKPPMPESLFQRWPGDES